MNRSRKLFAFALAALCLFAVGCKSGPVASGSESEPNSAVDIGSWQPSEGLGLTAPSFGPETNLFPAIVQPGGTPGGDPAVGFINENGEVVIPGPYHDTLQFSQGLAPVQTDRGWVYINTKGEEQFGTAFREAHSFSDDKAVVKTLDGVYGVIDISGESFTIPNALFVDDSYHEGLLRVAIADNNISYHKTRRYGYIDTEGKIAIEPSFVQSGIFSEGLAPICTNEGHLAYIDASGEVVLHTIYYYNTVQNNHHFSNGMARVEDQSNKVGFINTHGNIVVPCVYDDAYPYTEGLAAVKLEGQWGFVNTEGGIETSLEYDGVLPYSEGYAAVYRAGAYSRDYPQYQVGFVNRRGEVVIDFQYIYRYSTCKAYMPSYCVNNGMIPVYFDNQAWWNAEKWYGYINNLGEMVYRSP